MYQDGLVYKEVSLKRRGMKVSRTENLCVNEELKRAVRLKGAEVEKVEDVQNNPEQGRGVCLVIFP